MTPSGSAHRGNADRSSAVARHQLGLELNESDVARLVDFLEALTGPAPEPLETLLSLPNGGGP